MYRKHRSQLTIYDLKLPFECKLRSENLKSLIKLGFYIIFIHFT